jgi:hypothetical protein
MPLSNLYYLDVYGISQKLWLPNVPWPHRNDLISVVLPNEAKAGRSSLTPV